MAFPAYVHSVVGSSDRSAWPVEGQGENECGCTVASNALNLLSGWQRFSKDQFVRDAGLFFQRRIGGSPSPITGWLIRRQGFGTHFGNLRYTNADAVLRNLIDRGVPVVVEIGAMQFGPLSVYGQHSMVLVGYSDPYTNDGGQAREDYYFVDSQWPGLGTFDLAANDALIAGVRTAMPGNRTIPKTEFLGMYPTRIYFPVFRSQSAHDDWYHAVMRPNTPSPLARMREQFFTGSDDIWVGPRG